MNKFLILFTFVISFSFFVSSADAAVITVCSSGCDSTTVQGAIDSASNYDQVRIIEAGTYEENVTIETTGIFLTSNLSTRPQIWSDDNAVVNITADDVVVSNLELFRDGRSWGPSSAALYVGGQAASSVSNTTIFNNILNASTGDGGPDNIFNSDNSLIDNNTVFLYGNNGADAFNVNANYISFTNNIIEVITNASGASAGGRGFALGNGADNGIIMTGNVINVTGENTILNRGITIRGSDYIVENNTIWIYGGSTDNRGIHFDTTDTDNNTIRNNTISTNGASTGNYGIHLENNDENNLITDNIISTNGTSSNYGIYLQSDALYNNVSDNSITSDGSGTSNHGVFLASSSNNNYISGNNIIADGSSTISGIYVNSNNIMVIDNTVIASGSSGTRYAVFTWNNNNFTAVGNSILATTTSATADTMYGILAQSTSDANISNNNITTIGEDDNYGIYFLTADNSFIDNNNVTTYGSGADNFGIYLNAGSDFNEIINNDVSTNGAGNTNYGVHLETTSVNNIISSNVINTFGLSLNYGIYIRSSDSDNTIVTGNNITTDGTSAGNRGIAIDGSENHTINNNNITTDGTNNNNHGIYLSSTKLSKIFGNDLSVQEVSGTGIYLSNSASNNTVYLNEISANEFGMRLFGTIGPQYNNITSNNISSGTGNYGISLWGKTKYNTFTDNTVTSDTYDVFDETTDSIGNFFINNIFNHSDIGFAAESVGKIFVQYPIDVLVQNSTNVISGATVTIGDSSSVDDFENPTVNGSSPYTTNSSGYIPQVFITEYMANLTYNASNGGYLQFNDYTISVTEPYHVGDSLTTTIDSNRLITFTLGQIASFMTLFGKGTDSFELAIRNQDQNLYGFVNGINASANLNSGWNHVVMTFDNGAVKLYVDGVEQASTSTSATVNQNSNSIVFGNGTNFALDGVKFYSKVLTQAEITSGYQFPNVLSVLVQATGAGSFGRRLNTTVGTTEGLFSGEIIIDNNLEGGNLQNVRVENLTGQINDVQVRSNVCNKVASSASVITEGVYC